VFAWVYPEHRDIALLSVQTLDAQRAAEFEKLWQLARFGHENRLCESSADAKQGLAPACIDWAAMAAIAGDHSCSSKDMLDIVLRSPWILGVADVAAQLKVDLARVPVVPPVDAVESESKGKIEFPDFARRIQSEANRAERLNALRTSDIRLQRADPAYATRAGANNAHFLQARPTVDTDALAYAGLTLSTGAELNAIGVYSWFHLSALQKATRLANETLTPDERRTLARAILADEAFALHFLEDTFAAGHVAGTWGDTSQRKGTHDVYNANGMEVITWDRSGSLVIMGDAHMRSQDAENAAKAVRASLQQLLDTAAGKPPPGLDAALTAPIEPDAFDVCRTLVFPLRPVTLRVDDRVLPVLAQVLKPTPVPGLGPGLGALPRFRSELGPFVGLAGSIEARNVDGGFVPAQTDNGWIYGLDLAFRAGLGLEGVIGDSGDGLVFASVGLHADTASTNKITAASPAGVAGSLSAAIPSRTGLSVRLRMPFYLVPGDLLLLSPLYLFAPDRYTAMAVTASNGGLIPWQLGWATSIGRFQFVLGRELGVTFYGLGTIDSLIAPPAIPGGTPSIVNFKSTSYELPILEYRPYRSFASNQSSAILFQLFAAADVPYGYSVVSPPGATAPKLDTVWSIGLRMVFDWRFYY
jgi:hypothetical protein